ncbi:MAG: TRAP transporter large permease subunit [Alphaproteobacteria bacterium]|nr:TRAP transporter large permease subunit [Alphaproteobacteria bacterium]MCB9946216.1 TRAP transporter large permease subunit [Rhodospirillaceae bacterium]
MYWEDYLPVIMFLGLAFGLFSGIPVAFVVGGIGLLFGFIGSFYDMFSVMEFFNIPVRIWGGAVENLVLVAVPCFIFMGTMLERSGVANDLLEILDVLLKKVPGGLAMSVTLMGTIMAATTGIIGASVVMMTLMALPTMLRAGYAKSLSTGTIAASATLGILIPPSIMLVIMADLLALSVGNLFLGAIFPGLLLSSLYLVYILIIARVKPSMAPRVKDNSLVESHGSMRKMVLKGFVPPVFLMVLVLGSIFAGWATPTEAAGVGAFGAILLTIFNGRMTGGVMREVCERTAIICGMIFFIFMGATAFSYVFRSLGGEDLIIAGIEALGFGSWGILIVLMATIFILGFFFDFIEITLIVLPVFAPVVAIMDFGDHVVGRDVIYWFAILVATNLQTSFLTPPFSFALFYMKGVAPSSVKIQDIYAGIIPFVSLQVIGLALVIAFPGIALWLPNALLE